MSSPLAFALEYINENNDPQSDIIVERLLNERKLTYENAVSSESEFQKVYYVLVPLRMLRVLSNELGMCDMKRYRKVFTPSHMDVITSTVRQLMADPLPIKGQTLLLGKRAQTSSGQNSRKLWANMLRATFALRAEVNKWQARKELPRTSSTHTFSNK